MKMWCFLDLDFPRRKQLSQELANRIMNCRGFHVAASYDLGCFFWREDDAEKKITSRTGSLGLFSRRLKKERKS